MKIYIYNMFGSKEGVKLVVDVSPKITIQRLKEKVALTLGYPTDSRTLSRINFVRRKNKMAFSRLSKTLKDYGISEGEVLELWPIRIYAGSRGGEQ